MNVTFGTLHRRSTLSDRAPAVTWHREAGEDAAGAGIIYWAEVVDAPAFAGLEAPWRDLCTRAAVPNVFMDPAFVLAVAEQSAWPLRVLLAWQGGPGTAARQLVGVWAVQIGRSRLTWPRQALISPVNHIAYLGTPVLDRTNLRPALRALLTEMRRHTALPDTVQVGDLSAELLPEFRAVLREERIHAATVETRLRARLLPHPDANAFWAASMSKNSRQRLERQRRQLAKAGKLTFAVERQSAALAGATEEFLALEAAGWKGRRKSALASNSSTAAMTRRMIEGLAKRGLVAIQSLRLDDRPAAIQVILYSGNAAFTWRVAFDESDRRASPGVLLLEDTTRDLLTDASVSVVDSCNHRDVGYQAERWPDRHGLVDLLIDLRPRRRLGITLLAAREGTLRRLKYAARHGRSGVRKAARRLYNPIRSLAAAAAWLRSER
jgi:CelD/BcsL family acetyltransferase involved in cellulose biosynthesis